MFKECNNINHWSCVDIFLLYQCMDYLKLNFCEFDILQRSLLRSYEEIWLEESSSDL